MTFFLDQSFGIRLKERQNLLFNYYNASEHNASLFCFFLFFHTKTSQVKLDKIWFLFNMTSH